MIRTETVTIRDKPYVHTYSDGFFYIECNGVQYLDAYDPIDAQKTYTETDISVEPTPQELDDALSLLERILAEAR